MAPGSPRALPATSDPSARAQRGRFAYPRRAHRACTPDALKVGVAAADIIAVQSGESPSSRPARWGAVRIVGAIACIGALATVATPVRASAHPASEQASVTEVSITGHGWGHGYGMGQWGALGYALAGWSYHQILSHYYGTLAAGGATTISPLSAAQQSTQVRVAMVENDDLETTLISDSGYTLAGLRLNGGSAAQIRPTSSSNSSFDVYLGPSCNGPWTLSSARNVVNPTAVPAVAEPFPADSHLASEVLQLCESGGNVDLRGDIEATANSSHQLRTVNIVGLEPYVADVTPAESPSTWGTLGGAGQQGQPWGFQALEAQAVAARSYVMSDLGGWGGYADTCDNDCQTYVGIHWEDPTASLAVEDTSPLVVMLPGGAAATTEYSASTGGYTVSGLFAAVPDAGDAVCVPQACNPNHTWQATVPASAIEATFPQIGTFESIDVTRRDGNGDWGGRVLDLTVVGSRGSVATSGVDFSSDFYNDGVISYWFEVTSQPSGGVGGYWLASSAGGVYNFGNAGALGSMAGATLNAPVVSMASTPDHLGYWLVASDGGIFSFGDAHFYGSTGNIHLNKPVVGMASTPDGRGYWLVAADGGIFSFGDAPFYGSTGNIHLNKPVVGMATSHDGRGYWLVAADGGIFSFGDAPFYGSTGNLQLQKPVVDMAASPDGHGYWMVAADGGIFSFGDSTYEGSLPSLEISETAVAMLATADGKGYLIACADGSAIEVGDAPQFGDAASSDPGFPGALVGGALTPS